MAGFILLSGLFNATGVKAQEVTVIGNDHQEALPLAHIVVQNMAGGSATLLITNEAGKVILPEKLSWNTPQLLQISCLGYFSKTDTLTAATPRTYRLERKSMALQQVVVTAQYNPTSTTEAVHRVKVIDAGKIRAMGAQNLRDVLTNELNIRLQQDQVLGSSLQLQGIGGQNVKLLIDGVAVTGRLNGNIDLSQIQLHDIERIEIVEGPLSVNYGTDALAGTINLITRKHQPGRISAGLNSQYESVGQYNLTGNAGFSHQKHQWRLSGGRNYFDGWHDGNQPFLYVRKAAADSNRFQSWKPKTQWFSTLSYRLNLREYELQLSSSFFDETIINRGKPRAPYQETAFDDHYATQRFNQTAQFSGKPAENLHLQLMAAYNSYNRIKNTCFIDLTNLQSQLTQNPGDQDTTRIHQFQSRGSLSSNRYTRLNGEIGYDVLYEKNTGIRILNQLQDFSDIALFGSLEYKPSPAWVIKPGLRIAHNSAYSAPLVPSLQARYLRFSGKDKSSSFNLRFSYARGFRAPSIKELYLYFVDVNHNIRGNAALQAEYSHHGQFSVAFDKAGRTSSLKLELITFTNLIDQMISLAQVDNQLFTYFNLDKFRSLGIQGQARYSWLGFTAETGLVYTGRSTRTGNEGAYSDFLYSPELILNLRQRWARQGVQLALFCKYTGSQPSFVTNDAAEVFEMRQQAYTMTDLNLSKGFWADRLQLQLGVKNLFDVRNINGSTVGGAHSGSSTTTPVSMGRNYLLAINWKFNS